MNQASTLKEWKKTKSTMNNTLSDPTRLHNTHGDCPMVLSFSSGKGGVGKTNMVTNTAIAMSRLGKKVMILDADLGLANIDVLLGLAPQYNIKHVLAGERSLGEVLVEGPEGLLILPAGSGVPELVNLSEAEKLLLLNEMEELNEKIDVMLIDTAAGISDNVLYFNMAAQKRIVVVTPEPTSVTDAYALIKVMANKHHVKDFSILVNWTKSRQEALKVFKQLSTVADRFLGLIALDYVGFIPKDDFIPKAVLRQRAVLDMYPESEASKSFMELAHTLLKEYGNSQTDGNIKFFWRHLLRA